MDQQQAYHYFLYLRDLQMLPNHTSDPNYQNGGHYLESGQSRPGPTLDQISDNAYTYTQNLQDRVPPMRLDLPPPPVFAPIPTPGSEFPNQYGPSTLAFSPVGDYPPNTLLGPNSAPIQHHYSQPFTPIGYAGSLPPSPYPTYATSSQAPGYLQQQQQQSQSQQPVQPYPSLGRQPQLSPYYAHGPSQMTASSNGSNESAHMSEYFPPFAPGAAIPQQPQQYQQLQVHGLEQGYPLEQGSQQERDHRQNQDFQQTRQGSAQPHLPSFISPPIPSPTWHHGPRPTMAMGSGRVDLLHAGESSQSASAGGTSGPKTNRQQFTACGACRHRRVKCDLKLKQEEAGLLEAEERARRGPGPVRTVSDSKKDPIVCTNCKDRHMKCV